MDLLKIGNYIQSQRKTAGMTQKQLAEKLNVSFQAVSKWENGDALPDAGLLLDLADALNTTTDKLLTGGTVMLAKRRRMRVADVVEGFAHIEAIGRCFGEDSTFFTGMVEGINRKMNIDLLTSLRNAKTREAMIVEVLIQGIMNGYTLDMDEVRVYVKNPRMIEAIEGYLGKTGESDGVIPLVNAAEGYRKARKMKQGQLIVTRSGSGRISMFENDLSEAAEREVIDASDEPIAELVCCWHNGEIDVPSQNLRDGLLAAFPENADAVVYLRGGNGVTQRRLAELQ